MTPRPSPLMLVGIVLLALNLFPATVSIGPVLNQVRSGLGMGDWQVALVTAVPLLAFAALRALAATAARIFGVHRIALISVLLVAIGLFSRALADNGWVFVLLTALAVCGSALLMPLLPILTRRHFPQRVSSVTLLYSTAAGVAMVLAVALSRPISHSEGGWRTALAVWGALAMLGALPWLRLIVHDRTHLQGGPDLSGLRILRTPLAWALSATVGLQALQIFTVLQWFPTFWAHQGYTPAQAGLLVALVAAIPLPLALVLPAATMWRRDPRPVVLGTLLCYPLAYAGLLLHPHAAALLCAFLLGIGGTGLQLSLVLTGLRARTRRGAVALTGATQSAGYAIAAVGIFGFGALRHGVHGWHPSLVALLVVAVVQIVVAWYAGRPAYVEDQWDRTPSSPAPSGPSR